MLSYYDQLAALLAGFGPLFVVDVVADDDDVEPPLVLLPLSSLSISSNSNSNLVGVNISYLNYKLDTTVALSICSPLGFLPPTNTYTACVKKDEFFKIFGAL